MATSEDRTLLLPPARGEAQKDQGEWRRVVDDLHHFVKARLAAGFKDAGLSVPRNLTNDSQLLVGVIESRLFGLKKATKDRPLSSVALIADDAKFSDFRRD
jgi:hypothetical protein